MLEDIIMILVIAFVGAMFLTLLTKRGPTSGSDRGPGGGIHFGGGGGDGGDFGDDGGDGGDGGGDGGGGDGGGGE